MLTYHWRNTSYKSQQLVVNLHWRTCTFNYWQCSQWALISKDAKPLFGWFIPCSMAPTASRLSLIILTSAVINFYCLDLHFWDKSTGKLKIDFMLVADNGPAEQPSCPIVQNDVLLHLIGLHKGTQESFTEYHSKRNFVEKVHAESRVLSWAFLQLTSSW